MAAGQGFKTFNTGDVLSASDVNGYLMQGIWVFANATARDAAVTSPQEGNACYLKDTDLIYTYNGSAWVASGASGDITAVTAGTGISGGGASGDVTITNSMATAIDAKGDLIVGTGADTFSRLAIGTNNYVLTADSAQATGMKWAAAAGGGKVLQVVQGTYSTIVNSSSTTYADTGLSVSITPSASTSKVLVLVSVPYLRSGDNSTSGVSTNIVRGSTQIAETTGLYQTGTALGQYNLWSYIYLDSPSTTSATTYKVQFKNIAAVSEVRAFYSSNVGTITCLEIGA